MEDKEFLERALQIQVPCFVRGVKLDLQEKKVELEIGLKKGWRHLNIMQCEITMRAWRAVIGPAWTSSVLMNRSAAKMACRR